ncbi:MAG TPA: hypothetical protein VFQ80_13295 [Thermomicrobiales bacterium]|nr:hypothetical protein [Thermomicrobiales bacterium]
MTLLRRRLAVATIVTTATAFTIILGHFLDARPTSFAEILGAAAATGGLFFFAWPSVDRRWTQRDDAANLKGIALIAAGLAFGALLSALPRLTETGAVGDFALFAILAALLAGSIVVKRLGRRPPIA